VVTGDIVLRRAIIGGLFCAGALSAASALGVYLDFEQPPSPAALNAMRKEAEGVLKRAGIRIAWRLVSENQGNEPFERLAVVRFTGKCACGSLLQSTREVLVLGTTEVVDGRVLPYSQVRCDSVRRLMPDIEYSSNRATGNAALGKVLARVLAHELYHSVLGTTHHTAAGLAKGFQSIEDLKSGEVGFYAGDWELSTPAVK
jgi:hypothetical protein